MTGWLVATVWLLALMLALTMLKVVHLAYALAKVKDAEHAKCIAHVTEFVGNAFAARVLEAAAEDYDSAQGKHRMAVLTHQPRPEGVTLPAFWLKDRASRLHPTEPYYVVHPATVTDRNGKKVI